MISVLNRYPVDVIREVTEPATGLPSISKWLPTVAEIRNECDVLVSRIETRQRLDRELQAQIASRETLQITDGRPRPTYADLVERCAQAGLFIGPKGVQRTKPEDVRAKYSLSKDQWDAIPNAVKA